MFLYLNQLRISSCRVFRGMYNNIWRINPSHLLIVIVEITFCNSNTGAKFWAVNVVSSHTLLLSTNFSCKIGMSTELMSSSDDPQLSSVYIVKHFDKKKFFLTSEHQSILRIKLNGQFCQTSILFVSENCHLRYCHRLVSHLTSCVPKTSFGKSMNRLGRSLAQEWRNSICADLHNVNRAFLWHKNPLPKCSRKMLSELLCGIPHRFVFFEDILIASKDLSTHRETLFSVLNILHENFITRNKFNCTFASSLLEFLGYLFTDKAVSPSFSKVDAIQFIKSHCISLYLRDCYIIVLII